MKNIAETKLLQWPITTVSGP